MPTASSIPGWAGYASYMQGQQRGTIAPSMNYRGISGVRPTGIGPVDPGDPSNPLNTPASGNPPTTAPFNPPPFLQHPTPLPGGGGIIYPGAGGNPYPSFGGYGSSPWIGNSISGPTMMPTSWHFDPQSGSYIPRAIGTGGEGGFGGGGGMMSFRPGDVTGGRDAMSGSGKRWWERIPLESY